MRPFEDSYVVPGSRLVAGAYPGSPPGTPPVEADDKLTRFIDAGITAFVDLTGTSEGLAPYAQSLRALAAARGIDIIHDRLAIRDVGVCDAPQMCLVLDTIDAHLSAGRSVYVHCWGGIGRTGMVIGCWLVRHGRTGEEALSDVGDLFRTMSPAKVRRHANAGSPQTEPQRQMVTDWSRHDRPARDDGRIQEKTPAAASAESNIAPSPTLRERYTGAMLGLAVGDALGTALEFRAPGSFDPVKDIVGGGPFGLKPGQWTDDTSMALCLAESLISSGKFDAVDQMQRYVRWIDDGYFSSTGRCFDIGGTVRQAVNAFRRTHDAFSGPTDEQTAGNGSLMRLAPVPLFFAHDAEQAIAMAADSSRTTHGTATAVDACRYFAGLIVGALNGASKEALLAPAYAPVPGLWSREPLHPLIAAVANGSFLRKGPPEIKGTGYVVASLEAALWAFATTDDFESGALAAVNLGDDADTTGAIFGQLAGAFYGVANIPVKWRDVVTLGPEICAIAEQLYGAATQ